jgi:hypothetical protein
LKKALEQLEDKDRATVEEHMPLVGTNADTAITDALEAAKKKQKECIGNGWHCNIGGHAVRLRDVADKVVKLVDLLTPIGDAAASLDPIHAGLPWAGVKVLIEVRE